MLVRTFILEIVILLPCSVASPILLLSSLCLDERGTHTMLEDISAVSKTKGSALRHRPIMPETRSQGIAVQTPRASRVKQKPEPYTADVVPSTASVSRRPRRAQRGWPIHIVLGMLFACLLLWMGQMVWGWGQITIDDFRYGRPRTTQVDHVVGHEKNKVPSHFIATNLRGQIYIVEIPGGSTSASYLLVGPHLIGPGADLAPVSMSFPGDPHQPDLLVEVNGLQMHFHNTGTAYVAM
jgi:hypothetical protein